MTVVGGLRVDGAEEVELLYDVSRLEGEHGEDGVEDFVVADGAGAEGVDVDADWQRVTDGVGELDFALGGEAGGDDVFGDPAAHVGGAAVHFGGVFAGEGTTTVTAHAAVAVDDDFTTGQAAIALRTADDEFAGGIDEALGFLGEHVLRKDLLDDLLDAEFFDHRVLLLVSHTGGRCLVLGGDDDVDDAGGLAVDVFHGDLAFRVRAQPFGEFACFADAGEFAAEAVGEHDGSWHELGGFVAGVTEHDALVTGALFAMFFAFSFSGVDTLGDVGALDGEVVVDEDLVGVEDVVGVGVADAADGIADDLADVDDFVDGLGGAEFFVLKFGDSDFTADDDDVAFHEGFASDAAFEVDGEAGVEDGVGDGIGDFVRMAFADGFGRKDV